MCSADSRTWRWRGVAAHQSRPSATDREVGGLRPDELERWLCGSAVPVPSAGELAAAFGIPFDAPAGVHGRTPPHRLRFTLAVLRDAFPDDGAVRHWLRAPSPELGWQRPLDLLLSGRITQLEEFVVREWNRLPAADRFPDDDAPEQAGPASAGYESWTPSS
jgi:hypothetical protein